MEDNQATITICNKGYSPKLRHVARTHKINLGSVFECLQEGDIELRAAVSHITTTALALASSRQDLGGSLNLPPGVGFIIMIYIEV